MGIPGLWEAISEAAERQSLISLAESKPKGLRIAVDISIWAFQCAGSTGGDNPTLRTFYYRLCRLANAGIAAVFVFDGPKKPAFKRGKRTPSQAHSMAAYKTLIRSFGFELWLAPGEAEAECAHLQARGIVDGVLSDDVDALMFGATRVFKYWAAVDDNNKKSTKISTHTLCYSAASIQEKCRVGAKEMVLIALLAGGDYIPAGVPQCGIKTAMEIGRAGYADSLSKNIHSLEKWREELQESLNTNSKKEFARRHPSLKIPENFPDLEILRNYTHPVVTGMNDMVERASTLNWYGKINFTALRQFGLEYFDWQDLPGDLKLVRTLAQPIFTQDLRRQSMADSMEQRKANNELANATTSTPAITSPTYCFTIHSVRDNAATGHVPELRISFNPLDVVPLELHEKEDNVEGAGTRETLLDLPSDIPSSPAEAETPSSQPEANEYVSAFDITLPMRIWIPREFVVAVYPSIVRNWELFKVAKPPKSPRKAKATGARNGTLDGYVRVTKYLPSQKQDRITKDVLASVTEPAQEIRLTRSAKPLAVEHQLSPRKTRSARSRPTVARPEVINLDSDTECAVLVTPPAREEMTPRASSHIDSAKKIQKSKRIVVRQSLPGAWREALPDEAAHDCSQIIDLS